MERSPENALMPRAWPVLLLALGSCTGADPSGIATVSLHQVLNTGESDTDTVFAQHALNVLVLRGNAPAPGVTVFWAMSSYDRSGSISANSTTTDASGIASAIARLGREAWRGNACWAPYGRYEVRAYVPDGGAVQMTLTAAPGNVARIAAWSSTSPIGLVNLGVIHTVAATDAYGNPVANARIDWAVADGGGYITPQSRTAEWSAAGCARVAAATHTLGALGANDATASLHGLPQVPPVTFRATAFSALVELGNDREGFIEDTVTVQRGGVVAWRWYACDDACWSPEGHNVTFEDDPQLPASSPTASSYVHTRTFSAPGTYRYRCTLHSRDFDSGEVGVVIAQ